MKVLLSILILLQVLAFTHCGLTDGGSYNIRVKGDPTALLDVYGIDAAPIAKGDLSTYVSANGDVFTLDYIGSGWYNMIVTSGGKGITGCVTAVGVNGKDAVNLREEPCVAGNINQQFCFTCVGTNSYTIKNRGFSKYLEAQRSPSKFVMLKSKIINCPWQTWIFEEADS